MIEKYDQLNVDETIEAVRSLDGEQLHEFLEFEREHQNRTTLIEPLERKLVTVRPRSDGYVAGEWFDDVEERVLRRSTRIERAIEAGDLQEVE